LTDFNGHFWGGRRRSGACCQHLWWTRAPWRTCLMASFPRPTSSASAPWCAPSNLRAESNRLFKALDLCWRWPESGDVQYTSRQLGKTICSSSCRDPAPLPRPHGALPSPYPPQSAFQSPFQAHDLYWRSPESSDLWYKSRRLKRTICSSFEGWRRTCLLSGKWLPPTR